MSGQISFSFLRQVVRWGTFGEDGKTPLSFISLEEMKTTHIKSILETQSHHEEAPSDEQMKMLLKKELLYRERKGLL